MAIGLGRMFGFHFLENFNYPYVSQSVTEFWRRWHISLSSWFRDYVYIPLGGSRRSPARNILNLAAVWLLTGLWHGAAWTFVLWGAWFFLLLAGEKLLWGRGLARLPRVFRHGYTLLAVMISWVLFRSPSAAYAGAYFQAMLGLGGRVLGFSDSSSSSAKKGESVADTIAVASAYADIIAMRHPKEGAPMVAMEHSQIPVINAGDGGHQHPTQTLTDLLTIRSLKGSLSGFTVGLCGDLKFGRTVHSLIHALVRYEDIRFLFISPEELKVPDYITEMLKTREISYEEVTSLEDVMPRLDLLYMTRVQKERFFNEEDYVRLKDFYILDKAKMKLAKPDMLVLHPLPRVNEISVEVDDDPRAAYFKQVQYGVYVRMALILTLLEI